MEKQSVLCVIAILILMGIIGLILTIEITPTSNQYVTYVISGTVTPSEEITGSRPQTVYLYYPYYNEKLCRSSEVQIAAIQWLDDYNGTYEIYFTTPVGLKEVLITTDCSSCSQKKISLDEIPESVDIAWGHQKCENNFQVHDDTEKVIQDVRNILNIVEKNIAYESFDSSDTESIKKDIIDARDQILDVESGYNDANSSLLYAYYAEWFALRSRYKLEFFRLEECVNTVDSLLKLHTDKNCFVPEYNSYKEYKSANYTYYSLEGSELLDDYPFDTKDIDGMKKQISYVYNQNDRVSDSLRKCEDSKNIMNETFEFQKPYCETRTIIFNITTVIWIIIFVYIGILIEKGGEMWKK